MLKLENITKIYEGKNFKQIALNDVTLAFRNNEFVSILGPSGSGKTTLLNIIGGLDKYTYGNLIIDGVSTRKYKERDWNNYRSNKVGFIFQSYNLINHQTVLSNVLLSLNIAGKPKKESIKLAKKVLKDVGLENYIKKKPKELSGGQMQRVAIARALVTNPDIILCDEPTGALDSQTSIQIMELLKEISKEKLVIMVTHNVTLANKYSDRVIALNDGVITYDTSPYKVENYSLKKIKTKRKTMNKFTSLSLSFNNLLTKKSRTLLTSFAGSIGIIGIALVLSLSKGTQKYINKGYYVPILICSLSIENFYKEFGLISYTNKLECIDKIEIPSVKFEVLKEYQNLFSKETSNAYMSRIYVDTFDKNVREKIQRFLNNEAFDTIVYSNTSLNKQKDLNGLNPLIYDLNLAKNYSIGLELETSHKDYLMFLNLYRILSDWTLKNETTVTNGVEINSNIMHYNKKSLRQLLYVCNFLNDYGFKINDECSNHIHIGFDAFNSVREVKTLLELFANNENIFYMMANEKETPLRKYYASYARPISVYLENAIYLHKLSDTKDLFDFMYELNCCQEDRLVAINFSNVFSFRKNTVEFRMSNGQTKYEEILLNMVLYLKLVDTAVKYKKIDPKLFNYITDIKVPEEERKSLLLRLLFKDNQTLIDKFNERYETNNEINSKLQRTIHYNRQVRF